MEALISFKNYFMFAIKAGSLGFSIFDLIIIFFSLFLSFILRNIFAKFFISKIRNIVKKTGNKIDDHLFDALSSPLKILPIVFVLILINVYFSFNSQLGVYFEKIIRSLFTIFIFWFLHQCLVPLSQTFNKLEEYFSKALIVWLINSLKYLIIFLGIVAIFETWGIKIGPVIAGLGLFGVAVALGAQDLFKNLISGIIIILEKRFNINDVIKIPDQVIGVVEHIGFRSVLIRKFDSSLVSIPNFVFSESSIINYSLRKYRRINWTIGLTYNTTADQLKNICMEIEKFISLNKNFIVNDLYKLFVRVEKFNDSSIDIFVCAFTNTNDWEDYLKIKEDLVLAIKNIVEINHSEFAFPTQSIYIEKDKP
jgi:MscS family membrane protein